MKTPDDETPMTKDASPPPEMESRRLAVGALGAAVAGIAASLATVPARAQTPMVLKLPSPPPVRAPRSELVNLFQYEEQARIAQGAAKIALIAGSDRTVTDRITLRPRINVPTGGMDLTCPLFGDQHFTPIIVGPMANQKRFNAEGEVATARGASAARAGMVVSSESSMPLATIAAAMTSPLWVQVYPKSPKLAELLVQAAATKARAVVVTVNAGASSDGQAAPGAVDWASVDAIIKRTSLPVIVKGVTRPQDAKEAVARGAKGVVVSNYRGGNDAALPGTLLLIEPVVQAVGDQATVMVDGSFRYGSDVLKALGLGAKAVMVGRPVMWGLAAYGADGVQGVVETLQTDLARFMGMCSRPTLASINSSIVRVHAPLPKVTSL
jgi:4-hydroxymandelate oxidase